MGGHAGWREVSSMEAAIHARGTCERLFDRYHTYTRRSTIADPRVRSALFASFDRMLLPWLPKNLSHGILDVACGEGSLLCYLREQGYTNLAGCDLSPENVAICRALGLEREERLVERAKEDIYFAEKDRELIDQLKARLTKVESGGAAPLRCPKCHGELIEKTLQRVGIDLRVPLAVNRHIGLMLPEPDGARLEARFIRNQEPIHARHPAYLPGVRVPIGRSCGIHSQGEALRNFHLDPDVIVGDIHEFKHAVRGRVSV